MIETRRREIVELLEKDKMSAKQLSDFFRVEVGFILEDLKHISISLKNVHKKLKEQFSVCNVCGYEFRNREKLSRPSKCPKCKSEDNTEPVFWID